MSFGQDPVVVVLASGASAALPFDADLVAVTACKPDGTAVATSALTGGVSVNGVAVSGAAFSVAVGARAATVKAPAAFPRVGTPYPGGGGGNPEFDAGVNVITPTVDDGAALASVSSGQTVTVTGTGASVALFFSKR